MKKILALFLIISSINVAFGQEQKAEKEQRSKLLDFVSKTGVIIKFEDYNLPNIKGLYYTVIETRVRKIMSGDEVQFFMQISSEGKYDTKVASIAYDDLLDVEKALIILHNLSENDLNTKSDYLENKFNTVDGFEVGYFFNNGKITWSMKLEKFGSGNTVFVKNYEDLKNAFKLGREKIKELKNNI